MTIEETIRLLQLEYDKSNGEKEHLLMAIKALKKQLNLPLTDFYPYNIALDIFGNRDEDSKNKAITLSVLGMQSQIDRFKDRDKGILYMRYKEKMTYDEIGNIIGMSGTRVRQIVGIMLIRLRRPQVLAKAKSYSYYDVNKYNESYSELQRRNRELEKAIMVYSNNSLSRDKLGGLVKVIDVMAMDIDKLGLSVRAYNALARANIKCLGDIRNLNIDELRGIKNMGNKTVQEVLNMLNEYGIELRS